MDFNTWELTGLVTVFIAGALLHFLWKWTGRNRVIALFAPVNESTWEHLKLLFMPGAAFLAVEFLSIGHRIPGFLAAKTAGLLIGMLAIVSLFYTYVGIIGRHYLWADILVFGIGDCASFAVARSFLNSGKGIALADPCALILLAIWLLVFFLFTYSPPHIALFRDPVYRGYGVMKQQAGIKVERVH